MDSRSCGVVDCRSCVVDSRSCAVVDCRSCGRGGMDTGVSSRTSGLSSSGANDRFSMTFSCIVWSFGASSVEF